MVQGKLVNETRCLQCETTTSRQEAFYELSLEIEQNSSLSTCLRNFRQGLTCPVCPQSCYRARGHRPCCPGCSPRRKALKPADSRWLLLTALQCTASISRAGCRISLQYCQGALATLQLKVVHAPLTQPAGLS